MKKTPYAISFKNEKKKLLTQMAFVDFFIVYVPVEFEDIFVWKLQPSFQIFIMLSY